MAEKTFSGRLILDRRTHQEWMEADPVAKLGEIMIVEVPLDSSTVEQEPCFLLKVGDGIRPYSQLNWFSGLAADVYDWAKAENKPTYTANEITNIDTYLVNWLRNGTHVFSKLPIVSTNIAPSKSNEFVTKKYVDEQIDEALLDKIYPVDSVYISYNNVSPASLFGGTWTRILYTFLYANDTALGNTGGVSSVKLSVANLPSHNHNGLYYYTGINNANNISLNSGTTSYKMLWYAKGNGNSTAEIVTGKTGSGTAFSIMPPFTRVAMWRRTA